MSLFTILILFFAGFIIWNIIKVMWRVHQLRNNPEAFFRQVFGQQAQPRQAPRRERPGGWSAAPARPKRYAPADGEYVRFEEITVTETNGAGSPSSASTDVPPAREQRQSGQSTRSGHRPEPRIDDADWEEI